MGLMVAVQANNEIVNFGPTMCKADEVGHLEDRAARQVSQGWPILHSSSKPTLFSINPATQIDGVWLILALDPEEASLELTSAAEAGTITTPESLATKAFPLLSNGHYDHLTPRDRWLLNVWNRTKWRLSHRFTFRITWAPNFFLKVDAEVHTAKSMLAKGKITWKANEEDMVNLQQEQELSVEETNLWPCPRLYVHIVAREERVPIPAKPPLDEHSNIVWKAFVRLAEAYIGPLVGKEGDDDTERRHSTTVPVHLILEPLYVGVLPQTALGLLAILVPVIAFAVVWVVPPITEALHRIVSEGEEQRIKTE
ncbi:hypothetical protein CBS101457_005160 [Exobasidium rhododendri]|nr:hypothetical protein CBS101457_005160 [Exobasidium rhododendri]